MVYHRRARPTVASFLLSLAPLPFCFCRTIPFGASWRATEIVGHSRSEHSQPLAAVAHSQFPFTKIQFRGILCNCLLNWTKHAKVACTHCVPQSTFHNQQSTFLARCQRQQQSTHNEPAAVDCGLHVEAIVATGGGGLSGQYSSLKSLKVQIWL